LDCRDISRKMATMNEKSAANEEVIHFSCEHCEISLTVDDSLAGVTGPCPSCGEVITAPRPGAPQKIPVRPREMKGTGRLEKSDRSERGSARGPSGAGASRSSSGRRSRSAHRPRSVSPETGVSEAHRERAEVAAVAKMLVAGLVVLAIVLAVAFWLNHRFSA